MTELSFHKELYAEEAVEQARATYADYASIELSDEAHRWVLRITATTEERADRIAAELSNFALGLTVEQIVKSASSV